MDGLEKAFNSKCLFSCTLTQYSLFCVCFFSAVFHLLFWSFFDFSQFLLYRLTSNHSKSSKNKQKSIRHEFKQCSIFSLERNKKISYCRCFIVFKRINNKDHLSCSLTPPPRSVRDNKVYGNALAMTLHQPIETCFRQTEPKNSKIFFYSRSIPLVCVHFSTREKIIHCSGLEKTKILFLNWHLVYAN